MNLPLLFARRYLLAKRSRNAVNIITLISITVIAVVAAAMVVVLSTMNGISELVDSMYSPFDQDLTITPHEGKTFARQDLPIAELLAHAQVQRASWVIEENVLLRSGGRQAVATMKGVEPQYLEMSRMEDFIQAGEARLHDGNEPRALLGIGLKLDLDVPLDDGVFRPLEIAAPVRGRRISRDQQRAFESGSLALAGAFSINLDFDQRYVLVPLGLAAELLHYGSEVNALELQLAPGARSERVAREVRELVGATHLVRTRHQKNALMYSTTESEKWFTFAVLVFIGLIGAFNIIASLTMMMIEKRSDMRTLSGMGATPSMVRRVFLYEGLLIVGVGAVAGMLLGLAICQAQISFGLIALEGSVVDSYPVRVLVKDLLLIFATVGLIGAIATWVPLRSLSRRYLRGNAVLQATAGMPA